MTRCVVSLVGAMVVMFAVWKVRIGMMMVGMTMVLFWIVHLEKIPLISFFLFGRVLMRVIITLIGNVRTLR